MRARMQGLGVDPDAARARVDAMNDEEVAALASRIAVSIGGPGLVEYQSTLKAAAEAR